MLRVYIFQMNVLARTAETIQLELTANTPHTTNTPRSIVPCARLGAADRA